MSEFHDYEIDYHGNPEALDKLLQQFGAVLLGAPNYAKSEGGNYIVRKLGNPGFFKFACENQGYCRIIRELADSLPGAQPDGKEKI